MLLVAMFLALVILAFTKLDDNRAANSHISALPEWLFYMLGLALAGASLFARQSMGAFLLASLAWVLVFAAFAYLLDWLGRASSKT
jgi:hypothetical protein